VRVFSVRIKMFVIVLTSYLTIAFPPVCDRFFLLSNVNTTALCFLMYIHSGWKISDIFNFGKWEVNYRAAKKTIVLFGDTGGRSFFLWENSFHFMGLKV